jgi:hypothetical protein
MSVSLMHQNLKSHILRIAPMHTGRWMRTKLSNDACPVHVQTHHRTASTVQWQMCLVLADSALKT